MSEYLDYQRALDMLRIEMQGEKQTPYHDRMHAPIHVIEDMRQRDLAREAREHDWDIQMYQRLIKLHQEDKAFYQDAMQRASLRIAEILEEIDPKHLPYTVHVEGELDDLQEISSASYVNDDGTIDGPVYSTNSSFWFMSEEHILARETRREDEGRMLPDEDNNDVDPTSKLQVTITRESLSMSHHASDYNDIGGIDKSFVRRPVYDLKTYCRNGKFYPNIRIMTDEQGFPKAYPEGFEPVQEYEELEIPIMVQDGYVVEYRPIYEETNTPAVLQYPMVNGRIKRDQYGNLAKPKRVPHKRRIKNVTCELMRHLWVHLDSLPHNIQGSFHVCMAKREQDNQFGHTKPRYVPLMATDEFGNMLTDEQGRPIRKTRKVKRFVSGGLHFRGSCQLSPESQEAAYNQNPRFNVVGIGAHLLKKRFLRHIMLGSVNICRKVEEHNGQRKITRQAWCLFPCTFKVNDHKITRNVVVFADIA